MKQSDGTLEEMQEDEVLFEKSDEYPVIVVTASVALTQATTHNIIVLNEKLLEAELEYLKLRDEIISLWEEINKRRKVEDSMIPLKENILERQK